MGDAGVPLTFQSVWREGGAKCPTPSPSEDSAQERREEKNGNPTVSNVTP